MLKNATEKKVLEILRKVKDPEIPVLSVVDMGMVREVQIENENAIITITPTFIGCPALSYMQQQIKKVVEEHGFQNVEVKIDRDHKWSTNDISEEGKQHLKNFWLAPPRKISGDFTTEDLKVACPNCGSDNTTLNSPFGSTLCRALHYCFNCKQGFEAFKPK